MIFVVIRNQHMRRVKNLFLLNLALADLLVTLICMPMVVGQRCSDCGCTERLCASFPFIHKVLFSFLLANVMESTKKLITCLKLLSYRANDDRRCLITVQLDSTRTLL